MKAIQKLQAGDPKNALYRKRNMGTIYAFRKLTPDICHHLKMIGANHNIIGQMIINRTWDENVKMMRKLYESESDQHVQMQRQTGTTPTVFRWKKAKKVKNSCKSLHNSFIVLIAIFFYMKIHENS